jgi:hypothetical protein
MILATWLHFEAEAPAPKLVAGDIAVTLALAKDGKGARVQPDLRPADGTWVGLLDRPKVVGRPVEALGAYSPARVTCEFVDTKHGRIGADFRFSGAGHGGWLSLGSGPNDDKAPSGHH